MNVREIAYKIITDVVLNDKFANLSLRELKDKLTETDQAFLSELVYGTLENYRYVRCAWERFTTKKADKKICCLLDMASYELLFLKSEDYAVINEACKIAKQIKNGYAVGFVNAILRQVATNDFEPEALDIKYSMPKWIYQMWQKQYSLEIADKILVSMSEKAPVYLRVNSLKTSKEELLKDPKFSNYKDEALIYDGSIVRTDYFKKGLVFTQDYHSQLVTLLADIKENERVLDLCAAPGTKTIHTACIMHNTGEIIAVDLYQKRVELIKQGLKLAGVTNTLCCAYDARKISEILEIESFDTVLVDAPCSGLGVLRHKSDIKQRIKPTDIDDLVLLQKEILDEASKMVKPKGKIVYSTCTLNTKENEKQIARFIEEYDYEVLKEETLFPFMDNSDGFFVAILQRKG